MIKSKKLAHLAVAGSLIVLVTGCGSSEQGSSAGSGLNGKRACVLQGQDSSFTQDSIKGIKSGMSSAVSEGLKIEVKNAQNVTSTVNLIAQSFVSSKCDVIIPIGTSAAQTVANLTKTLPIVFAAASTPVQSKLVKSLDRPGGNVTGTSDQLPMVPQIDAALKIMPNMKSVGIIWKNGDPAGEALTKVSSDHFKKLGVKVRNAPLTTGADVTQSVHYLDGKVDAIYLPGDATVDAAFAGIMAAANPANIPVFGISGAVPKGSILSGEYDYVDIGRVTGNMAIQILKGADPADTAVIVPPVSGFLFNETQAKKFGLAIPDDLLKTATKVY